MTTRAALPVHVARNRAHDYNNQTIFACPLWVKLGHRGASAVSLLYTPKRTFASEVTRVSFVPLADLNERFAALTFLRW
jgi:hypothetical protein